ncbi:MAG TPA: WecB/TagA/CpsF family glycosyltransferase [Ignavibacteria bacterium]|nr:WecB/TagA/CpsF family glycosyltransferase [Ignavibacteria bacterium]
MIISGLNIDNLTYDELLDIIDSTIKNNKKITIAYPSINILNRIQKDNALKEKLLKFDIIFSDGVGIYIASKFLYGKKGLKCVTKGTDLYFKILEYANKNNLKMFFYGGLKNAGLQLSSVLKNTYPDIINCGIYPDEWDRSDVIHKINISKPDILLVGLGTPTQEYFISDNSANLNVNVMLTIGNGINYISGYMKRAPKWMLKLQLEWLYRLSYEPGRLWKRYLLGIPVFLYRVLLLKFRKQ